MTIEFLLRRHLATGDRAAAARSPGARSTRWPTAGCTTSSAAASIATRPTPQWLVPHFEQMLYDNAQLARVYVHAWALTGDARYRAVATGTLDYMLRELTTDDGAFAASQDADTDGIEGLTFTWRAPEIREVLGDAAPPLRRGVRRHRRGQLGGGHDPVARVAPTTSSRAASASRRPTSQRGLPRRARSCSSGAATRPQPARDDKALAAWNGLAIAAFADAAAALAATDPAARARIARPRSAAAETSSAACSRPTGRSVGRGRTVGRWGSGVLEDYTHLADGLLALYEATFDERWFTIAPGR